MVWGELEEEVERVAGKSPQPINFPYILGSALSRESVSAIFCDRCGRAARARDCDRSFADEKRTGGIQILVSSQFRVYRWTGLQATGGERPLPEIMTDSKHLSPTPESGHSQDFLPDVYEELRRLATIRMAREPQAHTLQATALVHEAWLRLSASSNQAWRNPEHFYAAAAETMRRILIGNARRRARVRHGGQYERIDPTFMDSVAEIASEERLLLIDEGLKELEKVNPKRAQIVVLKFFGGLTNEEVAQSLDVSRSSVNREWACAKTWLFRWVSQAREAE